MVKVCIWWRDVVDGAGYW